MIVTDIPCKNYVRNYIQTYFGTPAKMNRDTVIGKYFYRLLEDAEQHQDSRIKLGDYKSKFAVSITEKVLLRKGFLLSPTSIVDFNRFIEGKIKDELLIFMFAATRFGNLSKVKAYDHFIEAFGLSTVDFNYEMIKKSMDRTHVLANVPKRSLVLKEKNNYDTSVLQKHFTNK